MKPLLPEVRAAIVKVVPEIDTGEQVTARGADIRLADVLRAIKEKGVAIRVDENGTFWHVIEPDKCFRDDTGTSIWWNLAADSLDDQSEETITFVHKVLYV